MPDKAKPGKGHKWVRWEDIPAGTHYEIATGYKGPLKNAIVLVAACVKAPTVGQVDDKTKNGAKKSGVK